MAPSPIPNPARPPAGHDGSDGPNGEDRPPLLRTWGQMYLVVILSLAATVLIFAALTWSYG